MPRAWRIIMIIWKRLRVLKCNPMIHRPVGHHEVLIRMRKWWQRWWQVRWQIHNKRNHVMSHKITNRLPHLCNVVHSWVFMSVIFMSVSKTKCQSLEMIYNFLGEKTKIIMDSHEVRISLISRKPLKWKFYVRKFLSFCHRKTAIVK